MGSPLLLHWVDIRIFSIFYSVIFFLVLLPIFLSLRLSTEDRFYWMICNLMKILHAWAGFTPVTTGWKSLLDLSTSQFYFSVERNIAIRLVKRSGRFYIRDWEFRRWKFMIFRHIYPRKKQNAVYSRRFWMIRKLLKSTNKCFYNGIYLFKILLYIIE